MIDIRQRITRVAPADHASQNREIRAGEFVRAGLVLVRDHQRACLRSATRCASACAGLASGH